MALHLQSQTTPGGAYTALDLVALRVNNLKLAVSYSHPSRLTFTLWAPAHTTPIPHGAFLRMWDDAGINPLTSVAFTESMPTWEGFVDDIQPGGDGHSVRYTALDPTAKMSREFRLMSLPWDASVGGEPPQRALGSTSRIVFNADNILRDEDAAHSRENDATIGEMIETMLGDSIEPLRWCNAAPADLSDPYVVLGELDGLDYQPTEKQVFQDETLRSAFLRLLQHEPSWRMVWYPGERRWRFGDLFAQPAIDVTLNDFDSSNPYHVLSLDLSRSLEDRYSSVCFYGPARIENTTATTLDASLVHSTATAWDGLTHHYYTIADPTKQRMAGVLAQPISTPVARSQSADSSEVFTFQVFHADTWFPTLQARFPDGPSGDDGWYTINGWWVDKFTGVVDIGTTPIQRIEYPIGDPVTFEAPDEVRFIYGRYIDPYTARYPAAAGTYEGTSFTELGLKNELSIYDEMLTVGWVYNVQITTVTRLARFAALAEKIHKEKKDVVYTGGLTLDGLVYDFSMLSRCVNLPAVDGNGDPLVTGWEALNAPVTDVEFDFSQSLTTVQFSSDQAALAGINIEQAKIELKIRAAVPVFWQDVNVWFTYHQDWTEWGTPYLAQQMHVQFDFGFAFVDEEGGYQ